MKLKKIIDGEYHMFLSENIILWKNLEHIRDHLLLDDEHFAIFLEIPYIEYIKSKNKQLFLSLPCLFEFSEKLNLHFEDLLSPEFKLNSKVINNNREMALSARYSIATYSKTRPILNIINYVEIHRGTRAKINLLRKFQLTEEFLLDQNNNVNILLISDIVNYLQRVYQFKANDFLAMGQRTPFMSNNKMLSEQLLQFKTINETYDFFVEECSAKFDKNYKYRILNNTNNQIIIEATPEKSVLDELKIEAGHFGNENACLSRMGVISSVPWVKYQNFSAIKKIQSIYSGGMSNIYSIDTSFIKNLRGPLDLLHETQPIYH
jgi:hypothetical protein